MKHKKGKCRYERCASKCGTCTPGCSVCILPLDALTTECPGTPIKNIQVIELIKEGIDYFGGKWCKNLERKPEFKDPVMVHVLLGYHCESGSAWIEAAFYDKDKCDKFFDTVEPVELEEFKQVEVEIIDG